MNRKEDNDIALNNKAMQIIMLVLLCIMSLQPLVGITTSFYAARSVEELGAMVNDFFLMKSELIRYNGYVALIVAVLAAVFNDKMSIGCFAKKIYRKKPWNVCFTFLFILILVNVFAISPFINISLNGDPYRFEGLFSIVAYAGFFVCASSVKDEKLKRIWMNVTIAASTVLGVCALYSLKADNPVVLSYMNRVIVGEGPLMATFPQFNHYGYYLCINILLLAGLLLSEQDRRHQCVYMILLAFHQYMLGLNGTRGSLLATFFALIFLSVFALVRNKGDLKKVILIWLIILLAIIPAFSVVTKRAATTVEDVANYVQSTERKTEGGSGRIYLWMQSVELIKTRPLRGYGLNMASYALDQIRGIKDMPHNEYLQHFVDLGLFGFLAYVGALLTLFVATIRKIKEIPSVVLIAGCGVIAYAISAFFGVTIVEVIPFFYILLGFVKWEKPAMEETEKRR